MPEHENDQTDCEKLLDAIEQLTDALDALAEMLGQNEGQHDESILDVMRPIARALLNLTQIYEANCTPDENGNGNG